MNKTIAREDNSSNIDPVAWLAGVTATGVAAAMALLGTSILAV
jgi:hypothetical protein